jgi:hypothetical protein
MTLILSCVTPTCVYQVSDRRLTWLNGPRRGQILDDERNKAVFVEGRFAFGYTGLAEIGTTRTDDWLAHAVATANSHDMAEIVARIRERATESFRAIQLPGDLKRHAFHGVGWAFRRRYPGGVPCMVTVTNAIGGDNRWLPAAEDSFTFGSQLYPNLPDGFKMGAAGQQLKGPEQAAIWRLVRRCARRSAPPGAFVRSLLISMRWLAGRYPSIGPSLMALSIPRRAAEAAAKTGRMTALMTGPNEHTASFLCFGPNGRAQWLGPHAATRGVMMTNFEATSGRSRPPGA